MEMSLALMRSLDVNERASNVGDVGDVGDVGAGSVSAAAGSGVVSKTGSDAAT